MDIAVSRTAAFEYEPSFIWTISVSLAVLIVGYLWYIFFKGPKDMKDLPPYDITNVTRWYNIFQVVACSIFVVRSYQMGFDFRFLWRCESFDFLTEEQKAEFRLGTWFFLALRLIEFVETIFFIMRKKNSQASFLHIYHHISTAILMWIFIAFDTELMAMYNASINSFVHVIMYMYYFLSSFQNTRGFLNAVKPLITIMQLVQFVLIMGHCIIAILPECHAGIFFYLQICNLLVLTCFFSHFFIVNYLKKK